MENQVIATVKMHDINTLQEVEGVLKLNEHYLDALVYNWNKIYPNTVLTTPTKYVIKDRINNTIKFEFELKDNKENKFYIIAGNFSFITTAKAIEIYTLIENGRK